MVDIPGLFKSQTPSINAEEIFKPIYLGLERKRRNELDRQNQDDREFARSLKLKQEERSETAAKQNAELYNMKKKLNEIEYLKLKDPEALKTLYPGAYEQYKNEKEKNRLNLKTMEAYEKRLLAESERARAYAQKFEKLKSRTEKQQQLMTDGRAIQTNMNTLVGNLKSAGFLTAEGETLLKPPVNPKTGMPRITEDYMKTFKDRVIRSVVQDRELPAKYVNQIFDIDETIGNFYDQYNALRGVSNNIAMIEDESNPVDVGSKQDFMAKSVAPIIRKVMTGEKRGSIMAGERIWQKRYGSKYGNAKELFTKYIETGDIPSGLQGNDKDSYLGRALLKKLTRSIIQDVRDFDTRTPAEAEIDRSYNFMANKF